MSEDNLAGEMAALGSDLTKDLEVSLGAEEEGRILGLLQRAVASGQSQGNAWMTLAVGFLWNHHLGARTLEGVAELVEALSAAGAEEGQRLGWLVAKHGNLPVGLQRRLVLVDRARKALASRSDLTPEVLTMLIASVASDRGGALAEILVANPSLTVGQYELVLSAIHYPVVVSNLAGVRDLQPAVQHILAREGLVTSHRRGTVRPRVLITLSALVSRSDLDPELRRRVVRHPDEEVRCWVARRSDLTLEESLVLLRDERSVKERLWECSPHSLVHENALAEGELTLLAFNPHIAAEVAEQIAREGDNLAAESLAASRGDLPDKAVRTLIERFPDNDDVLLGLARRYDLPVDIACAWTFTDLSDTLVSEGTVPWDVRISARLAVDVFETELGELFEEERLGEDWRDLAPSWQGSVESLIEACRLTRR